MRLSEQLKESYIGLDFIEVNIEGLPPIFIKPLTLNQAREINAIENMMERIAKTFQVRAKDQEGKPLVNPGEFDDFKRFGDIDLISKAVLKMNESDEPFEDTEKNS